MEAVFILFIVVIVLSVFYFRYSRSKGRRTGVILLELLFGSCFILSIFLFLIDFMDSKDFYQEIDPIYYSYTPLASTYLYVPLFFEAFGILSAILVYFRGRRLPPLVLLFALVFIVALVFFCVVFLFQISYNSESYFSEIWFNYIFLPSFCIMLCICALIKIIREESQYHFSRKYKNQFLNSVSRMLVVAANEPIYVLLFIFPACLLFISILTVFGQDQNAFVKVFTETSTWHFSKMEHPPFLPHEGHYLCTVAACGHSRLVKPIRYGVRRGRKIVVNRQLMIANAFEERIMELSPRFHHYIRSLYDRYGYPLSKHITSPIWSDIVYVLMKPLEWFFIIFLYFIDIHPEKRILRQYESK